MEISPLFTVFTPTYNRAQTLRRTYESLTRQTLPNFEWLVIDDGSTDNTRELVQSWQQEADFPVRYLWQENASKAAAWNCALELAQGDFFTCLDSDDECVPEALAKFKEAWESIPASERTRFVGVAALVLDQDGELIGRDLPRSPIDCTHTEAIFRLGIFHDAWQCYRTAMIRRFPFDLIPGYRNCLPEGTVINRVATAYVERFVNDRLLIYHMEENQSVAEHLSSGVDASVGMKHAPGIRALHLSLLRHQIRWMPYAPIRFYKSAANYIRFSWMQGISVKTQMDELGSMPARALWLAALPAAFVLRMRDREMQRRSTAEV